MRGRFRAIGLVAAEGKYMSWAMELYDSSVPDSIISVRFPTTADMRPGFAYGELVEADGVVLADGVVKPQVGDKSGMRCIYFVSGAVISVKLKKELARDAS